MEVPFLTRLMHGEFAVALEITPPQKDLPKVLLRRARLLGGGAQAINIIQRPGRQSSLDASLALKHAGMEPAWHLVTRGRTREEVADDLRRAAAGGIAQVLCILGDHAASPPAGGGITIREAVTMASDLVPGVLAGATVNQYETDRAAVIRNLLPKIRAGARYVQTQPVFGAEALGPLLDVFDREAPGTWVVGMAMPLLSLEAAQRIEARIGVELPADLKAVLARDDQEAAWGVFAATIRSLVESPRVHGVAVMTFEMDPPAEVGARVIAALEGAGVACPR